MKTQHKVFKILFLLSVFFISAFYSSIKAQSVSTYYTFGSEITNTRGLKIDKDGNFYFINYDKNWKPSINRLSTNGLLSVVVSGNYYPNTIAIDNAGNLFFSDEQTYPAKIKKVNPDGTISDFASGNIYPMDMTFNSSGEMYFTDGYDWPGSIKKVTSDGTVSSFLSEPNSFPQFLAFDKSGILYFVDNNHWPSLIKKIAPAESSPSIISNNYGVQSLVVDSLENLFILDVYSSPIQIKKITPGGTVSILAPIQSYNYENNLTVDKSGNVYFIDHLNGKFVIRIIQNAEMPCTTLPPPVASDTAICYGTNISLSANGFGEIRWYDAPAGGNLLQTGSNFTTPALTTPATYYIESYFCNTSTTRTALKVSVFEPPVIAISGMNTDFDSVVLTASGGASYLWSGGNSPTRAQNTFTRSGTYSVTVKNAIGCSSTTNILVTVNAIGLNKYGNILSDRLNNVNNYGAIGTETKVDRNGKMRNNGTNGLTADNAAASAYEIKQNFPASADGYYWIKNSNINGGAPFQIYADMTTDGGGWTLIMCNKNPNAGWTNANAVLRNQLNPTNDGNYSIIAWADYIKKGSTGFQYMMDAHTRGNYGGIWTVNQPYSFVSRSNANTDITIIKKFSNWNYFEGGGFGPRMPWWTTQTNDGIITTSQSGTTYWWGTLIAGSGWGPSPWLSGETGTLNMRDPGIIWYWVR